MFFTTETNITFFRSAYVTQARDLEQEENLDFVRTKRMELQKLFTRRDPYAC